MEKSITELVSRSDHIIVAIWAADCAERVLPYFEETYPNDYRPRQAIEAGRAWVRGELKMTDARKAAFAARDAHQAGSARSAARAAGHVAATAHVASHAIHAASYAAAAVRDATGSPDADARERDWQYQHLLRLGENLPR